MESLPELSSDEGAASTLRATATTRATWVWTIVAVLALVAGVAIGALLGTR